MRPKHERLFTKAFSAGKSRTRGKRRHTVKTIILHQKATRHHFPETQKTSAVLVKGTKSYLLCNHLFNISSGQSTLLPPNESYFCEENHHIEGSNQFQAISAKIAMYVNQACHILCFITVVICYSFVFKVILNVRKRDKEITLPRQTSTPVVLSLGNDFNTIVDASNGNCINLERQERTHKRPLLDGNHLKTPTKRAKETPSSQNTVMKNAKSAVVLFTVAIVYILMSLPTILCTHEILIEFSEWPHALYIYYINNIANPIIYTCLNSKFRTDVLKLLHCGKKS